MRAKVAYFSTKIVQCSSSKRLFHVTNQLADRKKPQLFPTCYPLVELPQRFADCFLDKFRAIPVNQDSQTPEPRSTVSIQMKHLPFSFSCFQPVSETKLQSEDFHSEISTKTLWIRPHSHLSSVRVSRRGSACYHACHQFLTHVWRPSFCLQDFRCKTTFEETFPRPERSKKLSSCF